MAKKVLFYMNVFDDKTFAKRLAHLQKFAPLSNMFGINSYWWDGFQDPNHPDRSDTPYLPRFNRVSDLGITRIRIYVDQLQSQPLKEKFAFNPTYGGWFTDKYIKAFKDIGIKVMPNYENNPQFIVDGWATSGFIDAWGAKSFPPYAYADRDKAEDAMIWTEPSRMAFVSSARYGKNKTIDPALTPMWQNTGNLDPSLNKPWQVQDTPLIGQDLLTEQEYLNEIDGTWRKKPYGYLTGRGLAAVASAVYDGHKGAMGKGYGAKTANPDMTVVMNGLATADPNLLKGYYDWCVQNRGFRADGMLDVPCDKINYHKYSTDGDLNQYGNSTTGMPPELSGVLDTASAFVEFVDTYLNGLPVIITEWGNDLHPQSPFRAPAIGTLSADLVQAAWYIRTMIGYQARKIQEMYLFQLFANKAGSPQQFDTMYLLNNDDPVYTRTIAGDYIKQFAGLFGAYSEVVQISSDPVIYKYTLAGKPDLYCIWRVEQATKLKDANNQDYTVLTELTSNYNLSLVGKTSAVICTLTPKSDNAVKQTVPVVNNMLAVQCKLTPTFILVG